LTTRHQIKPTSPRCPSAWQPNPGRGSTYRRGKSVQTTGTTSLGNKVRAETFDNFLDHAVAYREKNLKNEAGAIAGVVFEDTIRKIYADRIGDSKGMRLEDIINDLAKKDVITGQQSKQAKVAAHVRTKATHALWGEFDMNGVDDAITITRLFLREHLGG
jgi:hypothetical protein